MKRKFPKHVSSYVDARGKRRLRFRKDGRTVQIKSAFGTDEFTEEYEALLNARPVEAPVVQPLFDPTSFNAIARGYYSSRKFRNLSPSSQKTYRGIITRFCAEHGHLSARTIQSYHIQAILDEMSDRPAAAMNLRKRLRGLLKWARPITKRSDDPCSYVDLPEAAESSDGFHAWTDSEIAKFRDSYPIGTRERLALELLLGLAARRSDAHRLGPQHIEGEYLKFVPHKTRRKHPEEIYVPITQALHEVIRDIPPTQKAFVINSRGRPYTAASFGNWIRDICNAIGLTDCTSHGLRKATARRLAEEGKTVFEIMAVGGWKDIRTVERYTRSAKQKVLATRALGIRSYDEGD